MEFVRISTVTFFAVCAGLFLGVLAVAFGALGGFGVAVNMGLTLIVSAFAGLAFSGLNELRKSVTRHG